MLRDDLLGYPLNGSKHRKYLGLFQEIATKQPECVVIYGSINSNHFVMAIDYANRFGYSIVAFTKKPYTTLNGNAKKALQILTNHKLIYTDNDLELKAEAFAQSHKNAFLIPLGGYSQSAAISSLSLGYEIANFDKKTKLDHIILDAGTGLQASSCLIALQERSFQGQAHVILMGNLDFSKCLDDVSLWTGLKKPEFNINILRPILGKKYGSTNTTLETFRRVFFENTNIHLDAVYNSKSFFLLKTMLDEKKLIGNILIVHSGGTYSGVISE